MPVLSSHKFRRASFTYHAPMAAPQTPCVTADCGRRSLRLSGDWSLSRLRSAKQRPSASQGSHAPTASNRIPCALRHAPQTETAASLPPPSTTPGPDPGHHLINTTTTLTPRQKLPTLYLVTLMQRHHHCVSRSHRAHVVTRSRGRGGAASQAPMAFPVPLHRSSSHGAAFIGPMQRSARCWRANSNTINTTTTIRTLVPTWMRAHSPLRRRMECAGGGVTTNNGVSSGAGADTGDGGNSRFWRSRRGLNFCSLLL